MLHRISMLVAAAMVVLSIFFVFDHINPSAGYSHPSRALSVLILLTRV